MWTTFRRRTFSNHKLNLNSLPFLLAGDATTRLPKTTNISSSLWLSDPTQPLRPEHPNLWQKAMRLLRRARATGFRKRVVSNVKFVQMVTPTGLVLPRALSIPVEPYRVVGTVVRIIKGLYYHETKRRFPETHRVIPYDMLAYQQAPLERQRGAAHIFALADELQKAPLKRVGRIFAYQWDSDPKQPANTRWLLNFFEGIRFVCLTLLTGANLLEGSHD